MIKVSVIIPVYNSKLYLKTCLDSVISQTLADIEIICIDDGSNDNSLNILNEYKNIDTRITVIESVHKGAGYCRNLGQNIACGEYLYFLDSDDWIKPDALEKLYSKAIEHSSDIVVCKNIRYNIKNKKFSENKASFKQKLFPDNIPFSMKDAKENALQMFIGWAWDKLFRHEFIKKYSLEFQNTRSSNDLYYVLTSLLLAEKIDVVCECLVYHRIGNSSSLENTRYKDPYCFLAALRKFIAFLKSNNLFDFYSNTFYQYLIDFTYWQITTHKSNKTQISIAQKVIELFHELNIDDNFIFEKSLTNKKFKNILEISYSYSCFKKFIIKSKDFLNQKNYFAHCGFFGLNRNGKEKAETV